jgi:tetratricopeptide (TPR) repeat protein
MSIRTRSLQISTALLPIILLLAGPLRAETAPPQNESTEQRAARLLKESQRRNSVDAQASRQAAESAYQAGLKLYDDLEYEEARKCFERALAIDPAFDSAKEKLRCVDALLGIHTERVGQKIRELEAADRVQREESNLAVANLIEEGRKLEEAGTVWPANAESLSRERILAEQLRNLQRAQEKYKRAKELLSWLRGSAGSPSEREQVEAALKRLSTKLDDMKR